MPDNVPPAPPLPPPLPSAPPVPRSTGAGVSAPTLAAAVARGEANTGGIATRSAITNFPKGSDSSPPQKTLLQLQRCSVGDDGAVTLGSEKFSAMINPAELTLDRGIAYTPDRVPGLSGKSPKFSNVEFDKLRFALVLDGTGVVPLAAGAAPREVHEMLGGLHKVIYDYDSEKHEPSRVRLLWGRIVFFGRLTSMSTQYTLFRPNGDPLRAKVTLAFQSFLTRKQESLVANRSSPDLSHSVEVRSGDTLPLLCQRIYGDGRYYLEVARFNGLQEFRRLRPGMRLHFPPLA